MLKGTIRRAAFSWLEQRGYDLREPLTYAQRKSKGAFFAAEHAARCRYEALDTRIKQELPMKLEAKYKDKPVLGLVRVYDAIAELGTIIDPLDPYLGCVSQLTHQLQLLTDMENDGVDETLRLCGLVHDLGKLLIKFGDEDPMNVEAGGEKVPLHGTPGCGLLNCVFRWDHGDFAYLRLKDHVAPEVSWIVRHHSIDIAGSEPYMDEYDRVLTQRYLIPFMQYDLRKDLYAIPGKQLQDYRPMIEAAFPNKIWI
jgi:hypothetical protein